MFHTALSRVNILHKRKVLQELYRLLVYKSPNEKKNRKIVVIKVQVKRTGEI